LNTIVILNYGGLWRVYYSLDIVLKVLIFEVKSLFFGQGVYFKYFY